MPKVIGQSLATMAFCAFALPASAQQWEFIESGQNGTRISIDRSSIRDVASIMIKRPFPVRQVWVEWNYSAVKSERARRTVTLEKYNCSDETAFTASYVSYSANGSVLKSWTSEDYDFKYEPVVPGTLGRAIFEAVCSPQSH